VFLFLPLSNNAFLFALKAAKPSLLIAFFGLLKSIYHSKWLKNNDNLFWHGRCSIESIEN